jgi:hypothetical protein
MAGEVYAGVVATVATVAMNTAGLHALFAM